MRRRRPMFARRRRVRGPFASGVSAATEHHLEGAAEHMKVFKSFSDLCTRSVYQYHSHTVDTKFNHVGCFPSLKVNSIDEGRRFKICQLSKAEGRRKATSSSSDTCDLP